MIANLSNGIKPHRKVFDTIVNAQDKHLVLFVAHVMDYSVWILGWNSKVEKV